MTVNLFKLHFTFYAVKLVNINERLYYQVGTMLKLKLKLLDTVNFINKDNSHRRKSVQSLSTGEKVLSCTKPRHKTNPS